MAEPWGNSGLTLDMTNSHGAGVGQERTQHVSISDSQGLLFEERGYVNSEQGA